MPTKIRDYVQGDILRDPPLRERELPRMREDVILNNPTLCSVVARVVVQRAVKDWGKR